MRLTPLLLVLTVFSAVAQPAPPSVSRPPAPPRVVVDESARLLPPLGPSPVEKFRLLLEGTPADRNKILEGKSAAQREQILAKLDEFSALSPERREVRLQTLQLRWLLPQLLRLSPDHRAQVMSTLKTVDRDLVRARLDEWDILPPPLQQEIFENEFALRFFSRSPVPPPPTPEAWNRYPAEQRQQIEKDVTRWNGLSDAERQRLQIQFDRFFELSDYERTRTLHALNPSEREQMEKVLQSFSHRPRAERERALLGFEKFAGLNAAERRQFLLNAERWTRMPAGDRAAWRELVTQLNPPAPPLPVR